MLKAFSVFQIKSIYCFNLTNGTLFHAFCWRLKRHEYVPFYCINKMQYINITLSFICYTIWIGLCFLIFSHRMTVDRVNFSFYMRNCSTFIFLLYGNCTMAYYNHNVLRLYFQNYLVDSSFLCTLHTIVHTHTNILYRHHQSL